MGGKAVGLRTLTVDGDPIPMADASDTIDGVAGAPLIGTAGDVYRKDEPRASTITAQVIEDGSFSMQALIDIDNARVVLDYGNGEAVELTGAHARGGDKSSGEGTREVTFYGKGRRL